jgi:hypothetical protein
MKILFWNIRGFGSPDARVTLKNYCFSHKPDIVFLAEPMITFEQVPPWYWKNLNIDRYCLNDRRNNIPNLWGLWNNSLKVAPFFVSDQCLAFEISYNNSTVYVAAVYANNSYIIRRKLWADLTMLQEQYIGPWLFLGDFNAVLGAHEKRGKRLPPRISCDDFLLWTNAHHLLHLNTIGVRFTWANGREGTEYVALRLDRSICNHAWQTHWHKIHCCALFKHSSDHHPLIVSQETSGVKHAVPFRFFKAWTTHEDCARLVKEIWSKPVNGSPMICLQIKLKRLKLAFKEWNNTTFGNIDNNVRLAVDEVMRIQALIDEHGLTEDLRNSDFHAQLLLTGALRTQEKFWQEKSRSTHFLHGDRNTSYFHRLAKIKASTKRICLLQTEQGRITTDEELELFIVEYFKSIFCGDNSCTANNMIQNCIPSLVSLEDNRLLTSIPSADEVKSAVFTMNGDGAPGPDGFSGFFYQTFWDIIGFNVIYSVQSFFLTGKLPRNINSNMLILIPKSPEVDRIENFRPIALANFQFKIVTKILADRLATVASTIVSPQQRGFIPGR